MPSGHLVYAAAGALRAVAFDLERLEPIGTPVPVVTDVATLAQVGTAEFDVARDGTLVYVSGGSAPPRTLVWVDRQGQEEAIKAAPARSYMSARLSPDGTRVAIDIQDQSNDIWVWDFARETLTRVTSDAGFEYAPVWVPDGLRLVFSSQAGGPNRGSLFWQAANGTGQAERLTESSNSVQRASAVAGSPPRVLFTEFGGATLFDVMMLSLEKDHTTQGLLRTPFAERNGEISPDGRWLAYESNESGPFQVYVRPFPDVNKDRWPVSTDGGTRPLWARNGQELFYLAPGGALMGVRVGQGAAWTRSSPTTLIDRPYFRGPENVAARTYDVSLDGKRFLMVKEGGPSQSPPAASIVVVQNWTEDLKRLVPTTR